MEIRNDFDADRPDNQETLERATDRSVVSSVFRGRSQGPNSWVVWSLRYDLPEDRDLEQALERFKSENPGQTDVLGAWRSDGSQVGTEKVETEVPNPDYAGEPYWIPNPAYQPDETSEDFDPRAEIENPAWVPETIFEVSLTGTPLYPIPGRLTDYMPGGVLADVHTFAGDDPKVF